MPPEPSPPPRATAADPRWPRIVARDAAADGVFFYSVTTTGVFCRPSCPSRTARPENVRIHATLAEAQATGARACRRCNPEGLSVAAQNAALIEAACRTIDAAETPPPLATLAADAALSPAHFHRLFRAITGLTPKGYAAAVRADRARAALDAGESVTGAIHAAGFGAASRFYDGARDRLGMAPARYRDGGRDEMLRHATVRGGPGDGHVLVASSATGIAAILLGDDPAALAADLQRRFPNATLAAGDADFAAQVERVVAAIGDPAAAAALPLDIRGTAFRQRVWQALRAIPPGTTATYADVARAIGAPAAVRAVASACAANAHAIAIPCHRVVRTDGGLGGYRWGLDRKRALLDAEAAREE